MTDQKYLEDPQEEKEAQEKIDFPSEEHLEEWQAQKAEKEMSERPTSEQASLSESQGNQPEQLPKKPKTKNAADFLMQNKQEHDNRQHSQEEKAANQRSWQRFVERPQPQHNYHNFPHYFYAGFWIRAFAFLVDIMCISFISSMLLDSLLGYIGLEFGGNRTPYGIIGLAVYLGYFILMTKMTNGQTIGKMIFGIQVVCFKEEKLSWGTVLVREGACRFILKSGFFMLGYLPAAFTSNKQHVGDLLSDTSVVTLNSIKAYNGVKF